MKLVFVTDNGFSEKNKQYFYSGGNIQHYSTVTKHFKDIVFIARKNSYDPSSNLISSKYEVHLINSITSDNKILYNYKKLDETLEKVIKKADIVMCFGINGYFAYKKARKYNKPTLVYVGGCIYDSLINMDSYLKKIAAPKVSFFMKKMIKNADYVHYVDEYLIDRYPTKGSYLVCPSARIEISNNAIKKRINSIYTNDSKIVLGIIGYTHNKIKGIDTALKSLALLGKNYILQVVGRGDHTWLDKIAVELDVQDQVEFLGVLDNRDKVFEWLDTIDIYLQPSLTEGMPRATLEAMSRACPVISTSVGGLKTIIEDKYRVKVNDYHDIAEKVENLSKNQYLMKTVAERNFNIAKSYDFKILDNKRDKFYSNIINELEKNV